MEVRLIQAGLTGGIATGKSTVSEIFRRAGAVIIDADKMTHQSMRNKQPVWQEIVAHFGNKVLGADGEINRRILGNIIFNDEKEKNVLNQIVHPRVRQEIDKRLASIEKETPTSVVILDTPLLIEVGWHREVQEVILVYAPRDIQLQRLMARNGLSKKEGMARIQSQMPIEEKRCHASIIIDNSGDVEDTRKKTLAVYDFLVKKERDNF
jgi:dephospho-CoA kinase